MFVFFFLFKSISCFNEEIFISLLNGKLIKVPWNDQARHDHFYLSLQKIYFKTETDGECWHYFYLLIFNL